MTPEQTILSTSKKLYEFSRIHCSLLYCFANLFCGLIIFNKKQTEFQLNLLYWKQYLAAAKIEIQKQRQLSKAIGKAGFKRKQFSVYNFQK